MTIAAYVLLAERETIVISGGWVFLFMGLIFAPLGLVAVFRSMRIVLRGVQTRAMVCEYSEDGSPVVKFIDASGTERRAELSTTTGGTPVGGHVDIIYDPNHATDASDPAFFTLWVVPWTTFLLGASSLFAGILTLLGLVSLTEGP